jgi:hypothetical protein
VTYREWKPEEDEVLRKLFRQEKSIPVQQVLDMACSQLGRTRGSVRYRAERLGLVAGARMERTEKT